MRRLAYTIADVRADPGGVAAPVVAFAPAAGIPSPRRRAFRPVRHRSPAAAHLDPRGVGRRNARGRAAGAGLRSGSIRITASCSRTPRPRGAPPASSCSAIAWRACTCPTTCPFAVARFLAHFRPRVGVLMETEIWFNLAHACSRSATCRCFSSMPGCRNGPRAATGGWPISRARRCVRCAASARRPMADATRLQALGATDVEVTGNLKFDVTPVRGDGDARRRVAPDVRDHAAGPARGQHAGRRGAASCSMRSRASAWTTRCSSSSRGIRSASTKWRGCWMRARLRWQRRSQGEPVAPDTRVVLGDSMGEMFAYYGACDVAFVGGSLLPLGGQNIIEACAMGTPVLVGPHTFNFAEATELAVAAGAARRVIRCRPARHGSETTPDRPAARDGMRAHALAFAEAHRGATGAHAAPHRIAMVPVSVTSVVILQSCASTGTASTTWVEKAAATFGRSVSRRPAAGRRNRRRSRACRRSRRRRRRGPGRNRLRRSTLRDSARDRVRECPRRRARDRRSTTRPRRAAVAGWRDRRAAAATNGRSRARAR